MTRSNVLPSTLDISPNNTDEAQLDFMWCHLSVTPRCNAVYLASMDRHHNVASANMTPFKRAPLGYPWQKQQSQPSIASNISLGIVNVLVRGLIQFPFSMLRLLDLGTT